MTNAATGQVLFAKGIASSHDLGAIAKATIQHSDGGGASLRFATLAIARRPAHEPAERPKQVPRV
ncbi:MAG: hypothetical protein ACXVHX_26185 [Solirubrobacteraceae bacterium]